ncbi:MAG: YkgJ family cysteine cluster protein [Bacteroidota bacterium]
MSSTKNNRGDLESAFFNDGFQLASSILGDRPGEKAFFTLSGTLFHYIDSLVETIGDYDGEGNVRIDCKKGCARCCHQPVWILPYEALHLAGYINEKLPAGVREEIAGRAADKNRKTSAMKMNKIQQLKHPCPLLFNDACVAYEARPMACRIYLSLDVKSCETEYKSPASKASYPKLLEITLRAGQMINEGVCSYLSKKGISSCEWLLESSLNIIMTKPESFVQWLKGKETFRPRKLMSDEERFLACYGVKRYI